MGEPSAEIRWARDDADLEGAVVLRLEVFCDEQGVPRSMEIDGRDGQAAHLVARADGRVVGTLRLMSEGATAKIGRVAVVATHRRRGIASRMLELALERAAQLGCRRARLAAQLRATGVYSDVGFTVESEPFMQAGIEHVWMGRTIDGPVGAPGSGRPA